MGSLSIFHWVIVLMIFSLVFGTKKLRSIGVDLGNAIKGFKEGMRDSNLDDSTEKGSLENEQLMNNASKKRETNSGT